MKPIKFKEATKDLLKPQGMTDEECGSLPVWNGDGKQCISCWELTWKERFNALFFGRVWLGVLFGGSQPPVWMDCKKTVFPNEKMSLRWFNLSPDFVKVFGVNFKPYNFWRRHFKEEGKHFGIGLFQFGGRHLLYIGRADKHFRLCIAYLWATKW